MRYISGNAITAAATTQPFQVCTILISKLSRRKLPKGLFRLKISSRKNPATVGGSTSGRVRIPSSTALAPGFSFMIFRRKIFPEKKRSLWLPDLFLRKSTEDSSLFLSKILSYFIPVPAFTVFQYLLPAGFLHHTHLDVLSAEAVLSSASVLSAEASVASSESSASYAVNP